MKKKDMLLIFIFLALLSFADGLFYNFQELWLVDNAFSLKRVSVIFSLCSLLTVSVIFLCSNLITKKRLKKFMVGAVLLKIICIMCLYVLNSTGQQFWIKLFIMLDFVIDIEIITSVYPMMALINKNDREYAKKDIIYNGSYYIGVILTSLLLGKHFGSIHIGYNSFLYIALVFDISAFLVLLFLDLDKYIENESEVSSDKLIIEELYADIKDDKISKLYFEATLANQLSYNSIFGLTILLLTTGLSLKPNTASLLSMMLGIIAVLIGMLVLSKLTFKNDYVNMGIKLGGRVILYTLAAISGWNVMLFIAFAYAKLISVSYSHVIDAPYINRINKDYQLAFCNLKGMISYFGKSAAVYLCGLMMSIDLRLNFLIAGVFGFLELYLRFKALKLKLVEEGKKK